MSKNTTPEGIVEECRGYLPTHSPGSSYLWEFQGIPFNMFLNTVAVIICILLWAGMKGILHFLQKKKIAVFSLHNDQKKTLPKITLKRFFFMENWEFAQHVGLDGVAYMRALTYNMYQLIAMLPFVIIGLPVYYRGGSSTSIFSQLSITNLSLNDTQGPWILWTLALCCTVLYLIWIGLRFEYAYQWPRASGVCRVWNAGAHAEPEHRSRLDPGIASAVLTSETIPAKCCQCLLVNQIPNVLMLSNVPEKPLNELEKELTAYFSSFKPPVNVQWVRPLHNVYHVVKQERVILETEVLAKLAEEEYERTGHEPHYRHGLCGCGNSFRGWCCCCTSVKDGHVLSRLAREVYRDRLLADKLWLDGQYKRLNSSATHPIGFTTGVVFVGLESADEALRVATEFSIYLQRAIPTDYTIHPNTYTTCLPVTRWSNMLMNRERAKHYAAAPFGHLQLAPLPAEILWTNLMTSRYRSVLWWITQVAKSVGIFLLALLLTSPTYLLVTFNYIRSSDWFTHHFGIIVFQWVPALILVSAAGLVKELVILSEAWTKHGTYGGQEKVGQRTLFWFLLLSVLIFPSMGVTGLPYLIERLVGHHSGGKPLRLECIFLPDSAALFMNYIITSALLGSAVQLLQLGRWCWFLACRVFCTHSSAEARFLARTNAGPFPFRERYASMNLINTIVIAYTPITPIILSFGVLYYICDYLISRYAMLFVYSPNWFDDGHGLQPKQQFEGADRVYHLTWFLQSNNLSMAGICLACLNMCFFFTLRMGIASSRPVAIAFLVLAAVVIATCVLLSFLIDGRCCRMGGLCASRFTKFPGANANLISVTRKRDSVVMDGSIKFSQQAYTAAYLGQSQTTITPTS